MINIPSTHFPNRISLLTQFKLVLIDVGTRVVFPSNQRETCAEHVGSMGGYDASDVNILKSDTGITERRIPVLPFVLCM